MTNFMKTVTPKKKLLAGLIIYVLILGSYLSVAVTTVHLWRQSNIDNSPTVYITKTGTKYHNGYHYHGRNSSISLFEADENVYTACRICNPPIAPIYSGKPGFYFYNWVLISIALSFTYWMTFTRLTQKI